MSEKFEPSKELLSEVLKIDSNVEYIYEVEVRGNTIRYLTMSNDITEDMIYKAINSYKENYEDLGEWHRLIVYNFANMCITWAEMQDYKIKSGRNKNNTFYAFLKTPKFGEQEKSFHDKEDDDVAVLKACEYILSVRG